MKQVAICIFMIISITSCKEEVESIKPTVTSITESVYASGIVKSLEQYQVYASSVGTIKEIYVKEGDTINKGGAILELSNQTAKLNVDNAALSASFNDFNFNKEKLQQIEKEQDIAIRKLQSDSLLMVRQNKLWLQGIGTKVEQEQRVLAYQNSISTVQNLKLKYSELKKQIKFLSEQSKKYLSISKNQLSDYVVTSEIDGKIYSILKEKGEMVTAQTPVAIIGDANHFDLELEVDEYDIAKIKPGLEVILRLDSYQDEVFQGEITSIYPLMNEKSRTFKVSAKLVNPPNLLYPNLSAEANIVLSKKDNALTIPIRYLVDGKFVLLKNGDKKEIIKGLRDYQMVEILKGIDRNTEIILPE